MSLTLTAPTAAPLALTDYQLAQLTRLADRPTRYEAVIVRPDGARCLLGYLTQHSKRGLYEAVTGRASAVVAFLGAPDTARVWSVRGCPDLALTGGGVVQFSGRTQREAIQAGELTFVSIATLPLRS